jgi:hypothetical protein
VTEVGDGKLGGADGVREVDVKRGVGVRGGFLGAVFEMPEVGPGLVLCLC